MRMRASVPMHRRLARQLREVSQRSGTGIDVRALLATVERTYEEFDRLTRTPHGAAATQELKTGDTGVQGEHDAILAAILETAIDGMLVTDEKGLVEFANPAAEQQFAAESGGLTRAVIGNLLGPLAEMHAGGRQPSGRLQETTAVALDGRSFPAEFTFAVLDMAGAQRQLWITRDITNRVRANQEISEARVRFQDFAEASSDCFWELDRNLRQATVSSPVESEFSARLAALLTPDAEGKPPRGLAPECWRALHHHLSARQRFRLALDVRLDDGEMAYVSVAGKPMFGLDGLFRGYRGTGRDITREVTARRAARRAERRLIEAMDAAPCAFALVDCDLHLSGGNSALKILATEHGERLPFGRSFASFLTTALQVGLYEGDTDVAELLRGLAATGATREVAIGSAWYLVSARDLSGGGMVVSFSDVSALKSRERELGEAKFAAESASRLKSQFLATMSHELRTPLNAILGFSEVIRDGVFGDGEKAVKKYEEYAGSIYTSGQHLLSLISEILDLSKIEAGSYVLDVETFDLRNVLSSVLTIISPAAHKASVQLHKRVPDTPVRISADDRAIRQIALNLLANAVKFTPPGGHITAELDADDGMVTLSVTDTGIGIAKEHLQAVFELFRQVDSSASRRHEGTGLGLAITKRLVELHGGAISLESEVGIGTRVRVRLPVSVGTAAMPETRPESRNITAA
jgi:PAS domain S-box-containing protein